MKIKPLSNHILIEPIRSQGKTNVGVLLLETVDREKSGQGKVMAVGPGKKDKNGKTTPMDIKSGDIVLFSKYGPNEIKVDNKEYLIAEEKDILAILKK